MKALNTKPQKRDVICMSKDLMPKKLKNRLNSSSKASEKSNLSEFLKLLMVRAHTLSFATRPPTLPNS